MHKVLLLPGDGIGPEVVAQAKKVLHFLSKQQALNVELEEALVGGVAYDRQNNPLPEETLNLAKDSDAILLGAVGEPKYEALERDLRPEKGLLKLRAELDLFANLRPAILYKSLASASSLKTELVAKLDLMIVRELTGGIYFGHPRGIRTLDNGNREGFNTLVYDEGEITRIAEVAFRIAKKRNSKLCSVDKANVLEVSELWRDVVNQVHKEYQDVTLNHMYVDNAAMQLIKDPKQFDVMLTENMFGDILSDAAAMLTGSIGMLPSASLNSEDKGMYEPIHGSAPDIAGKNSANPLATILSVAMMLRYSLNEVDLANSVEQAVQNVIENGLRTVDIASSNEKSIGTNQMGDAVLNELNKVVN